MDIYIEQKIAEYEQRVYGEGQMPLHQKQVLREILTKEDAFWEREGRDYVYGQDEGEPPKGAKW